MLLMCYIENTRPEDAITCTCEREHITPFPSVLISVTGGKKLVQASPGGGLGTSSGGSSH